METSKLNAILGSECTLASKFCGVYASDRLPLNCGSGTSAMVVNLDPHNKPGSHWVAIYINNNVGEYFDSYGLPPLNPNILNFLKTNCRLWLYNVKSIQNETSRVCGHYCIWFLSQKAAGKSLAQIQGQFGENTRTNDREVSRQIALRYRGVFPCTPAGGCQQCCMSRCQ